MNQRQFCDKYGFDEGNFSKWISGKIKIKESTLQSIATKEGYKIETKYKLIKL